MVPDTDLQFQVALKALREVVMPAVDPANGVALEQLHLAIVTIDLARSRLPLRHARIRQELRNACDLADRIKAVGGKGDLAGLIAEADALLLDPEANEATLDGTRQRILSAAEDAVAASKGDLEIARAVIAAVRPQTDLARAWCLPAGFDVDPQDLPELETLLPQ